MLWAAMPFLPLELWSALVLASSVFIIWLGKYSAVELVVKIAIIVIFIALLVMIVLAIFWNSPDSPDSSLRCTGLRIAAQTPPG